MHHIYGINLSLPERILNDLPYTKDKADIIVKSSTRKLYNQNEVSWYHFWKEINMDNYLSLGKSNDQRYILHFPFEKIDFAVSSDGSEISYYTKTKLGKTELRHHFLNYVIPLVMNHRGIEALHASSVLTQKGAIAFTGKGGFGKSTIAASLIQKGLTLLSDDVVPIFIQKKDILTVNGLPEMNLYPRARNLLNLKTKQSNHKQLTFLNSHQHTLGKFPLRKIFFLEPLEDIPHAKIVAVNKKDALLRLIKIAHRLDITNKKMLENQFITLREVISKVTSKVLVYPKNTPDIDEVSSLVLSDIKN